MTHTYADGYGRWHAILPDTPRALTKAVNAIANELHARSNEPLPHVTQYVEANVISTPCTQPGYVHFIEYALD